MSTRVYYMCPACGHAQRSQAVKTITCHQCGKRYVRRKAKTTHKDVATDTAVFHVYRQNTNDDT